MYMYMIVYTVRSFYKVVSIVWNLYLSLLIYRHHFVYAFFIIHHHLLFHNLCTTLQSINPSQFYNFLLISDFNVNFCNTDHYLYNHLQDIIHNFSLFQVVKSFTHFSPTGNPSLLDLQRWQIVDSWDNVLLYLHCRILITMVYLW